MSAQSPFMLTEDQIAEAQVVGKTHQGAGIGHHEIGVRAVGGKAIAWPDILADIVVSALAELTHHARSTEIDDGAVAHRPFSHIGPHLSDHTRWLMASGELAIVERLRQ